MTNKQLNYGVSMSCMERLCGILLAFMAIFAGFQIHFAENPAVSIWWDIKAPVVRWIGIPFALWGVWCFIHVMRDIIRESNTDNDKDNDKDNDRKDG